MNAKQKTTLVLTVVFVALFIAIISIFSLNLREVGIKSAEDKARVTGKIIKDGLTAHMVSGVMDHREFFLKSIENTENVKNIWVSRAQSVIDQYGRGFNNEIPRDQIDRDVLASGKEKSVVVDELTTSTFRLTIPYIATDEGDLNCLTCHIANVGDTLGAVTIILDMSASKSIGIDTIKKVIIISMLSFMVIQLIIHFLLKPYVDIFEDIKAAMQSASKGDYSKRVTQTSSQETKDLANWVNTLMEKLQGVLDNIESKIDIFLTQKSKSKDPLKHVNETVGQLSDIYKYRTIIEKDESIEDVYERLASVLRTKFNIKNFKFIEADTTNKNTLIVYKEGSICCTAEESGCRADRTNTVVDSTQFEKVCNAFMCSDKLHICIPYSISNDLDFILSIISQSPEEDARVKSLLKSIEDYINASRPEIVSKKLLQTLHESARTDPLTKMYNRKFLEEYLTKTFAQAKRSNIPYGFLMVDIDYFKMVNDTYGHDVGDEAIKVIANVIKDSVREADLAVRFGGEEFIVLLYNTTEEGMMKIAEKIRTKFESKVFDVGSESFSKTCSVGASYYPNDGDTAWKCIKYADMALYEAKESGRNKVVRYTKKSDTLNQY